MPSNPLSLSILGPERPSPVLPDVLARLGVRGSVALVSAGWRYDEMRDEPLREALGLEVKNLGLYAAFRELERELPDLVSAWTAKQQALRRAKEQYRVAIVPAMRGCQALLSSPHDDNDPWFIESVRHLQRVDALFLEQARALHTAFFEGFRPEAHPLVRAQRDRMAELVAGCDAVLIAGGHVGVLQNRLSFYGVKDLFAGKHVVAWSGGAMCLSERVLLFHDHTTFGEGIAEYLDEGLGLVKDVVFLPHARQRLHLDVRDNMEILARRLGPAAAIGLENGAVLRSSALRFEGVVGSALRIGLDGDIRAMAPGEVVHA